MEPKKCLIDKLIEFAQKHKVITSIANSSDKKDETSYYFIINTPYNSDLVNEIKKFNKNLMDKCYECNLFHYPDSINISELNFIGEIFWKKR